MPQGKICSKCKQFKPYFCFHKDLTKKDKHKTICKECRKIRNFKNILPKSRKSFDKSLMTSMYRAIKTNKSGRIWERVVGYSLEDLKRHLEKQFTKEMSWNNYGSCWWIDKIIPRCAYHNMNEIGKCWSLKNLRPLRKNECISKRNRISWDLIKKYDLFDILPTGSFIVEKDI